MKFYKYIYYRIYSWHLKKFGKNDAPQWSALFVVSLMVFCNIMFIMLLLNSFTIKTLYYGSNSARLEIILTVLVLYLANYFIFIVKKKYKKIVQEFKNEKPSERFRNTIKFWAYIILSITLPILYIYLLGLYGISIVSY